MTLRTLISAIAPTTALSLAVFQPWLLSPVYAQSPAPESTQAKPTRANRQSPPPPPPAPPVNDTRPGGGLDPDDDACPDLSEGLRALIPVENPVLTTSPYPTFLFHIPAQAETVRYGEFSLLVWPGEAVRQYQTRFLLPESPGVISITLPEVPAHALAEDQIYRWYFQLYCSDEENAQPDFTLRGAVQRVALTAERSQQIQAASPAIWYDAIANVANQLQASPQDELLQDRWETLLQTIQAEDLLPTPFSGSVLPLDP